MCHNLYSPCHRPLYMWALPLPEKWCGTRHEYFEEYSVSCPTIGSCKCKHMQSCSWAYLYSLGVASSFGLLWMCSTSLHTTHTYECESPKEPLRVMLSMNTFIIISCTSALIVSREVSLCLWTYNVHEVPLIYILSSLPTQPFPFISLLH